MEQLEHTLLGQTMASLGHFAKLRLILSAQLCAANYNSLLLLMLLMMLLRWVHFVEIFVYSITSLLFILIVYYCGLKPVLPRVQMQARKGGRKEMPRHCRREREHCRQELGQKRTNPIIFKSDLTVKASNQTETHIIFNWNQIITKLMNFRIQKLHDGKVESHCLLFIV